MFRKLTAALAVVVLLGPAVVGVCVSAAGRHCEPMAHACCDGPRIAQCDCDGASGPSGPAEPAQRTASPKADSTPVALLFERLASFDASPRAAILDTSPPPAGTSQRLSLLSTLLI